MAQTVRNPPAVQETWVLSLGREDSLQKGMATASSTFAWRIPWTEKPGGLQSMGSQRVGHDWGINTHTHTHTHVIRHLSKPTECTPPRMNLNVNYRLCLVTMHQCKFIDFNECTALVGDVNSGKGCAYVGHQVYGSSRLLPAQVCWEPKTVLNNTVYLLKCFENYSVF